MLPNERPTKNLFVHSFKQQGTWPGNGGQSQWPQEGPGDRPGEGEMVILGAQLRLRLLDREAIREDIMRGLDVE